MAGVVHVPRRNGGASSCRRGGGMVPRAGAPVGGIGAGAGKLRRVFVCSRCGKEHQQYHGKCPTCGHFSTMDPQGTLQEVASPAASGRAGGGGGGAGVQALERIQKEEAAAAGGSDVVVGESPRPRGRRGAAAAADGFASFGGSADGGGGGGDGSSSRRSVGWVANGSGDVEDVPLSLRALSRMGGALSGRDARIPLSGRTGAEVQRVLGGGVVPGALVLIGGDPGVGKSTITLQIAAMMAHPELDFDALEEQNRQSEDEEGEEEEAPEESGGGGVYDEEGGVYDKEGGAYDDGFPAVERGGSGGVYDNRTSVSYDSTDLRNPGSAAGEDHDVATLQEDDEAAMAGAGAGAGADGADGGGGGAGAEGGGAVRQPRTVLYITAEETAEQVVARSRRMGLDCCERVVVLCRSEMSAICRAILQVGPDAVVMDSINTVYLGNLPQAPGTVTQIRECGQLLLRLAKDQVTTVFIVGHVTKGGEMAGPNMLAHMVDTVLYLEGDVAQSIRLLRVVKNRHGSDSECGVFTMDQTGLHAVANHSALFLESRLAEAEGDEDSGASSVVGVTLQGSRAILVEVQALVTPLGERAAAATSALSYRTATGIDKMRLSTLCAILDKHVPTLELSSCSVIVNVVGGTQVRDVATDLALAVAIASSYYNVPVPRDLAVCGEVDLAGRVRRSFQRLDVRVREAAKLGFRRVVIPQSKGWERLAKDPQLRAAGVAVVAVRSVAEALRAALGDNVYDHRPPHIKPPPRGKPPPGTGPPGFRFSRLRDAELFMEETAAPSFVTDGSWPRAAAMGGAAAAYAAAAVAAATAPPARGGTWPEGHTARYGAGAAAMEEGEAAAEVVEYDDGEVVGRLADGGGDADGGEGGSEGYGCAYAMEGAGWQQQSGPAGGGWEELNGAQGLREDMAGAGVYGAQGLREDMAGGGMYGSNADPMAVWAPDGAASTTGQGFLGPTTERGGGVAAVDLGPQGFTDAVGLSAGDGVAAGREGGQEQSLTERQRTRRGRSRKAAG